MEPYVLDLDAYPEVSTWFCIGFQITHFYG
ncbi:hypothetical protein FHS92_002356 [Sphingobium subterraneum]|uniref:Uncharacterized protein n=1 Tax=Sphingobium subterraneum TaxID=627688 RepID=A0A841J8X3_9SPHN|nr:hypothetical protein [Sphingobium subterraneum]